MIIQNSGAFARRTVIAVALASLCTGAASASALDQTKGQTNGPSTIDALGIEASVITADGFANWGIGVPLVDVVSAQPVKSKNRSVASNPGPAALDGNLVVAEASKYIGVKYVFGGATPRGFDCSGFIRYVYKNLGVNLPRSSAAQGRLGVVVSYADAQPGDLIYTPGHISIYAGNGMQIDSPTSGKTIQMREIWQSNPTFIRIT